MKMKKLSEYLFMGALGGTLYYMIEIIFRGYSHWSMFLLGGICFIFFAQQGLWTKWREPLWKQVLWCTAFVVSAEFITGIIVNKVMGWNVWNYTDQPFHLMGQICFPFVVSFFGTMYIRDYYKRISALLFIQRNKAGFSYSINLYCCQNELMPIFAH